MKIMKTKQNPKYLYRDDNERFTRQKDGFYTMDNSLMKPKYKYFYRHLVENGFRTEK